MSETTTMTVRIPVEVKHRLEKLAQSLDRSKAFIAGKAIEDYLDAQEWQINAINEAVIDADREGATFLTQKDVEIRVRKKLASVEKRKR